ncbi:MAG: MBL fold metallo-hydrolase [Patulibacter minatonensis]
MRWTWLGWAGVELEHEGATLVIDPLGDPEAVFAFAAELDHDVPQVVPAAARTALAGLVTHLHRDHADAAALAAALRPGAPVLEPPASAGAAPEILGLAQADAELSAHGLTRQRVEPWEAARLGPFTVTALPATDGLGDPQVSWLVEAGGVRIVHLGDTLFHGAWWPIALRHGPIDAAFVAVNGATVRFPHRRPASPLPITMDPDQAAVAAAMLGARTAVPIHAEGYRVDGLYAPLPEPTAAFVRAAAARGVEAHVPTLGERVELAPQPVADAGRAA